MRILLADLFRPFADFNVQPDLRIVWSKLHHRDRDLKPMNFYTTFICKKTGTCHFDHFLYFDLFCISTHRPKFDLSLTSTLLTKIYFDQNFTSSGPLYFEQNCTSACTSRQIRNRHLTKGRGKRAEVKRSNGVPKNSIVYTKRFLNPYLGVVQWQ